MSENTPVQYETVVAFAETFSQEEIDTAMAKFKGILEKQGATAVAIVPWGRRKLAYAIMKNGHAHFVILQFAAPGSACAELERNLRIEKGVIRFQTYREPGDPETVPYHYRNVEKLSNFVTDRGKIRPGRTTKLDALNQRRLSQQIKRARHLGLLPYTTLGRGV